MEPTGGDIYSGLFYVGGTYGNEASMCKNMSGHGNEREMQQTWTSFTACEA